MEVWISISPNKICGYNSLQLVYQDGTYSIRIFPGCNTDESYNHICVADTL